MCARLSVPLLTWLCIFSSFGTSGLDVPKLEDVYSHAGEGKTANVAVTNTAAQGCPSLCRISCIT